ncbi:MAG: DNA polymerase I, partial [Clostridiales Family XIII bacterium]|nr:DNA polymerase I [Clostridiales Family XIII bacterium]
LFEKLGLPGAKKTKTGYATGADVLEKLSDKSPVIRKVLDYRTLTKLRSTYIDGLIPLVAGDGRIHAHFQQTVAATGRISCTEPNLQNIPIRQDFGRQIRKAFIPGGDEYTLVGADYSQIELRILAHLSGDPSLVEDFRTGADIHRRTAARVFGVSEKDVTPQQRNGAKAVNFGVIYGMSSFGLSEGLGITRMEAESYIHEYFARHSAVKAYLDDSVESARRTGYAVTVLGRRRAIPELAARAYNVRQLGERLAMNTPIQGSAADIIKLAMIAVHDALRSRGLRSSLILQVHDELIIRTCKKEIMEVVSILKEKMESAFELDVPLVAEVSEGASWYELK